MRPSSWAFFNGRPALMLPLVNPRLVPFHSAADRLLNTPVQLPQDAPDMAGVIADMEVLLDQVAHSRTGPQRRFIAQLLWTFLQ